MIVRTIKGWTKGKMYFSINHVLQHIYILIVLFDKLFSSKDSKNLKNLIIKVKISSSYLSSSISMQLMKRFRVKESIRKRGASKIKIKNNKHIVSQKKEKIERWMDLCEGGKGKLSKTFPSPWLEAWFTRNKRRLPCLKFLQTSSRCPFFDRPSLEQQSTSLEQQKPPPSPPRVAIITFRAN